MSPFSMVVGNVIHGPYMDKLFFLLQIAIIEKLARYKAQLPFGKL